MKRITNNTYTSLHQMVVCKSCEVGFTGTGEWCKECSSKNYQEPIVDIPVDVCTTHILPHLDMKDIINLSEVSKEHSTYFNDNDIWMHCHLKKRVSMFIPRQLKAMCERKIKKNATHSWARDDIRGNPVPMKIINQTKGMTFDIYFNHGEGFAHGRTPVPGKAILHKEGLKPGEEWWCQKTYTTHKWIVVANKEWILENKVSNVGFSFYVNVLDMKDSVIPPGHGWLTARRANRPGETTPTYVKILTEPNGDLHPIKPLMKKYASYKHEFMRLTLDIDTIKKKKEQHLKSHLDDKKRLKELRRKTKFLEQKVKKEKQYTYSYDKTIKILRER